MNHLLRWPHDVAAKIAGATGPSFVGSCEVVGAVRGKVTLHIEFLPWQAMAAVGYPVERTGIIATDNRVVLAFPHDAKGRTWQHLNPDDSLCLWYESDPAALRWTWTDGFEPYLAIVSRHLQAEEYYRREGSWPWEDAPHGRSSSPHPILSALMRARAAQGRR